MHKFAVVPAIFRALPVFCRTMHVFPLLYCPAVCLCAFIPLPHGTVARHIGGAKTEGQQFVHTALDKVFRCLCHDNVQFRPAEFKQSLTAHPAGRSDLLVHLAAAAAHHSNVCELGHTLGHRLEQSRALCTAGGGKGSVLHVAAGKNAAILGAQGSACLLYTSPSPRD